MLIDTRFVIRRQATLRCVICIVLAILGSSDSVDGVHERSLAVESEIPIFEMSWVFPDDAVRLREMAGPDRCRTLSRIDVHAMP